MEEMENGITTENVEETSICIISTHNATTVATTVDSKALEALENKEKTEKHNSAPSSSVES